MKKRKEERPAVKPWSISFDKSLTVRAYTYPKIDNYDLPDAFAHTYPCMKNVTMGKHVSKSGPQNNTITLTSSITGPQFTHFTK